MNEQTFKDFGEALDLLEKVMWNSDGDIERVFRQNFKKLNELYRDVKGEYGYEDSSDKEEK